MPECTFFENKEKDGLKYGKSAAFYILNGFSKQNRENSLNAKTGEKSC